MRVETGDWTVFGLDLRGVKDQARLGVNQLLWGQEAGINARLESPVILTTPEGESVGRYVSGHRQVSGPESRAGGEFQALKIPEEKVLLNKLRLPASVEVDLEGAMRLEVKSSSPFPEDNVCFGWTIDERTASHLFVSLAICARSDVEELLLKYTPIPDTANQEPEVWALKEDGTPIVIQGYGEKSRQSVYLRRAATSGASVLLLMLCFLLLLAIPTWVRALHVDKMGVLFEQTQVEAAEALAMRESLSLQLEQAQSIQGLVDQQADYHWLLGHLTEQTPDDVYLQKVSIEGTSVKLTGWGNNAATYMNLLANDPVYVDVSAPSAFSRDRRTGLERFTLKLEMLTIGEDD